MKVKEVMTRDLTSLSPEASAKEALELLQSKQISGLPVIDSGGKLVGMFTEKEVLAFLLPSYIESVGSFVYAENPKATKKKFSQLDGIKVRELMRQEVVTIGEDVALCEAAKLMLTRKARRIPVLDKTTRVVGIVSRGDILKGFIKEAV